MRPWSIAVDIGTLSGSGERQPSRLGNRMAAEFGLVEVGWFSPGALRSDGQHSAEDHDGPRDQGESGDDAANLLAFDHGERKHGNDGAWSKSGSPPTSPSVAESTNQSTAGAHRKIVFVCIITNSILVWGATSLMMPFFTPEALRKFPGGGVEKHAVIGLIFGIATYLQILVGPLVAKDMPNAGSKLVLVLSAFEIAAMTFLFGFVNRIDSWTEYVALSLAIRFVQGIATAANIVSATSIITGAFPDTQGTVMGVFRSCIGFGYAVGTMSGGVLFHHGGFAFPFYVGGAALLLNAVVQLLFLPEKEDHLSDIALEADVSFVKLLSLPWVWVVLISLVLIANSFGYIEPPMPVYFKEAFGASSVYSGLGLLLQGVVYGLACPVTGLSVDRWHASTQLIIILGFVVAGMGCLLIGPATFIPIPRSLGLSFFSFVLFGASASMVVTPAMPDLLRTYEENDFPNPMGLRAAVASIFQAPISTGYGTGPVLGNALTSVLGFPNACASLGVVYLAWAGIVSAIALWIRSRRNSRSLQRSSFKKLPVVEPPDDAVPNTKLDR